ncbi:MAG: SDR family oxidoreductase [Thermoflavifilum sp.]|nr:SDR family oxidoreductase [Thermoflavifilum sp.]
MEQLFGKRILVVGATGGIGQHLCPLLKQSGARLFISGKRVDQLQKLVGQWGIDESYSCACDVTNPSMVQQLFHWVDKHLGGLDILINLSGIGLIKPIDQLAAEEFEQVMRVNIFGAFYLTQAALERMRKQQRGLLVHVPGILGKAPMAGAAAYCASKYALVGMMQSIREELKRTAIRISLLYFGGVDTPFWDHLRLQVQREKLIRAEEAARAVWFVCQQPDSGVVNEMVIQPFSHQVL